MPSIIYKMLSAIDSNKMQSAVDNNVKLLLIVDNN